MAYRVELTPLAASDAAEAFERVQPVAPESAARWLEGLFDAILTLREMPARCPVVPEADELSWPVRHLIYGKRSAAYRIIFDIEEDSPAGSRVRVLRIRRGSREALTAKDLA